MHMRLEPLVYFFSFFISTYVLFTENYVYGHLFHHCERYHQQTEKPNKTMLTSLGTWGMTGEQNANETSYVSLPFCMSFFFLLFLFLFLFYFTNKHFYRYDAVVFSDHDPPVSLTMTGDDGQQVL